jgi:hypothetical protein
MSLTDPRSTMLLPASPLTPWPKSKLDMIARCRNAITRDQDGAFFIGGAPVPSESELAVMRNRLIEIREGLRPTPIKEVKVCLARLFLMFPSGYWTDEKARATMDVYAPCLVNFSPWAIERAFVRVVESGCRKPPTAPEFRKMVLAEYSFAIGEQQAIEIVLSAKIRAPKSAEARKAAMSHAKNVIEELGAASSGRKARVKAEADVASGFAHLRGSMHIGPALQKVLKQVVEAQDH